MEAYEGKYIGRVQADLDAVERQLDRTVAVQKLTAQAVSKVVARRSGRRRSKISFRGSKLSLVERPNLSQLGLDRDYDEDASYVAKYSSVSKMQVLFQIGVVENSLSVTPVESVSKSHLTITGVDELAIFCIHNQYMCYMPRAQGPSLHVFELQRPFEPHFRLADILARVGETRISSTSTGGTSFVFFNDSTWGEEPLHPRSSMKKRPRRRPVSVVSPEEVNPPESSGNSSEDDLNSLQRSVSSELLPSGQARPQNLALNLSESQNIVGWHGALTVRQTERLMAGEEPGAFLVRQDSNFPGQLVLAVKQSEQQILHILLLPPEGGMIRTKEESFGGIAQFLAFHARGRNFVLWNDLEIKLMYPIARK